ncbi:hypothetical protein EPD60_13105 [Flaviaesturariibacter flavus]|uniref:Uncharacterized protein n=1 Tax=Flaviaesturariibacter flavus TaxID=2502780 RepID=A0A4R1B981_9BACT|nr:hypothetical protein [Flaviaesturariibacter flavus]TCJ13323.1 hypothetical protein EPD60_13105 [Flaviaesturariibacter flavus]
MKPVLLLLGLVAVTGAHAQNQKPDLLERALRERLVSKYRRMPNARERNMPYSYRFSRTNKGSQPGLLPPSEPGVYNLPVDGMPCVVPDTAAVAKMPNAWPNPKVPFTEGNRIPNPLDKALLSAEGK